MGQINILGICLVLFVLINTSFSLECYVCHNQEDNNHKCTSTMAVCEQGEDVCLTEVKWGSMPYWQQGAEKQYYISKRCATRSHCEKTRSRYMPFCTRIWYEDWRCSECCQGDRCNYFVILAGSTARSSVIVLLTSLVAVFLFRRLFAYQ